MQRQTDRLLTPAVVMVALVLGAALVVVVIAAVTFLAARGYDPKPVVTLATAAGGAAVALVNLLVNLGARAGVAKVERTTGADLPQALNAQAAELFQLRSAIQEHHALLDEALYEPPPPRHAADDATVIRPTAGKPPLPGRVEAGT